MYNFLNCTVYFYFEKFDIFFPYKYRKNLKCFVRSKKIALSCIIINLIMIKVTNLDLCFNVTVENCLNVSYK